MEWVTYLLGQSRVVGIGTRLPALLAHRPKQK